MKLLASCGAPSRGPPPLCKLPVAPTFCGEGVFKFSEILPVLCLALCFLHHLPAGHYGRKAQPTQDLEVSSPWSPEVAGF